MIRTYRALLLLLIACVSFTSSYQADAGPGRNRLVHHKRVGQVIAPPPVTVTIGDSQTHIVGPHLAFNAPFNAGPLTRPADYEDTSVINVATFPNDTTIAYRWPAASSGAVKGYMFVSYGNYSYNNGLPVTPAKIGTLGSAYIKYAWEMSGSGTANQLTEWFVTSVAGDHSTYIAEVGYFPHVPADTLTFFNNTSLPGAASIGTFVDFFGQSWIVRKNNTGVANNYLMFVPADGLDRPSGQIDVVGTHAWLASKGYDYSNGYINGIGAGIEPIGGSGSIHFTRFDVAFNNGFDPFTPPNNAFAPYAETFDTADTTDTGMPAGFNKVIGPVPWTLTRSLTGGAWNTTAVDTQTHRAARQIPRIFTDNGVKQYGYSITGSATGGTGMQMYIANGSAGSVPGSVIAGPLNVNTTSVTTFTGSFTVAAGQVPTILLAPTGVAGRSAHIEQIDVWELP